LRWNNVLDMVRRRAIAAGLTQRLCCHTYRATAITAYLECGGTILRPEASRARHTNPLGPEGPSLPR
jgi:hypothetical protein